MSLCDSRRSLQWRVEWSMLFTIYALLHKSSQAVKQVFVQLIICLATALELRFLTILAKRFNPSRVSSVCCIFRSTSNFQSDAALFS